MMLTMTSLHAQNNFGALIDASQRGRAVSLMVSVAGEPHEAVARVPEAVCAAQNLLANRPQPVAQAKKVTPRQVKDSLI